MTTPTTDTAKESRAKLALHRAWIVWINDRHNPDKRRAYDAAHETWRRLYDAARGIETVWIASY